LKSFSVTAKKKAKKADLKQNVNSFLLMLFCDVFFLPILAKHVKSYETFWEISLSQVQAF